MANENTQGKIILIKFCISSQKLDVLYLNVFELQAIVSFPAQGHNFGKLGLEISQEILGCGSTKTCFEIKVIRSLFSEKISSIALNSS